MDNPMLEGRMVGEYTVRKLLGRGGMGEVWEGYDPDLDRPVAIKVILPHLSNDPTFGERLRREAKLVAALRQSNIVQLYDFDIIEGQAIMVMEYLAGGSLRDRLSQFQAAGQPIAPAMAAGLLQAVGAALDYAHARGAVHRDLKPANILFADEKTPVISDFGIAKIVNAKIVNAGMVNAEMVNPEPVDTSSPLITPTQAEPGSILGTPAYMSPEQAGGGEIDHRSDLYSLGVVLYEMMTGRLPFTGNSPKEILIQHLHHEPPSPRAYNPQLSAAVEEVLLRALAKKPAERFANATEMVQAFRSAAQLEGLAVAQSVSVSPLENGDAQPTVSIDLPTVATAVPTQDPPTVVAQPEKSAPPSSNGVGTTDETQIISLL